MFKIIGGDGKEYGPVTVEQLRQWVVEGRANATSLVRRETESNWQTLGSLPELAAVFSAPPITSASASDQTGTPYDGDYDLDVFGCLSRGWEVMSANFGLFVGAGAIYLLIIGGLSGLAQIPFIGPVFSIVSLIITGPLVAGVYMLILRLMRRQRGDIGDIFNGFRDNMGQFILGHIIPALISGACALPGAILTAVPIVIMVHNDAPSAGLIALAAAGLLLASIPLLYLSICWAFTIPLIADRRLDFWSAMKASRAQVGRHWWTIFGLAVVVGLVNCVGLLVCCVGTIITMPLAFAVMLLAYETLFCPRSTQPGAGA
jgi:hypothetical protein